MTDYFALLDEPRRPWLDADSLKQKFLARSAEVHPDRVHGAEAGIKATAQQRYTELNTAYLCLREPRERLRHLLELELGRKPGDLQEMPAELADLFMEISEACRQADGFLIRYASITSPLVRAQSFAQVGDFFQRLTALQEEIKSRQDRWLARLQELDRHWVEAGATPEDRAKALIELEVISRWLGFFSRWQEQIRERLLKLVL